MMDKRGSREGHLKKKETMWSRSVTRILCGEEGGGGGGGWTNNAKVDETTKMYFYRMIRLFRN